MGVPTTFHGQLNIVKQSALRFIKGKIDKLGTIHLNPQDEGDEISENYFDDGMYTTYLIRHLSKGNTEGVYYADGYSRDDEQSDYSFSLDFLDVENICILADIIMINKFKTGYY